MHKKNSYKINYKYVIILLTVSQISLGLCIYALDLYTAAMAVHMNEAHDIIQLQIGELNGLIKDIKTFLGR